MPVNLRVLFNYEAIRSFGDNAIYRRGKQMRVEIKITGNY